MGLPDVIGISPLAAPVAARVSIPGSKSITNRALILAALAGGETTLRNALWSEDTQVMVDCLRELGFMVNLQPDPSEPSNRTLHVYGKGGLIPPGGTSNQPLDLFVGNAGTAARFLAALLCLGKGYYRLHGVPRMHERPQAALFHALRQLGYSVLSPNDRLPVLIQGAGPLLGACQVGIEQSSQFASALLLCARSAGWRVEVTGENPDESPYVVMTSRLIQSFPSDGGTFVIEPDASSASYFWAADVLLNRSWGRPASTEGIQVVSNPNSDWQIDAAFPQVIASGPRVVSRATDLADSILSAMVLAPFAEAPVEFTELGRLRVQECERVLAMRQELSRCGVEVAEQGDTLTVYPSANKVHGAEIETYGDHRIAMSFSIMALKVPGIRIKNPSCVKKTFPNFFQKLAAPRPDGLAARIQNAISGQIITGDDLLAE